jgi:hypothetical protein
VGNDHEHVRPVPFLACARAFASLWEKKGDEKMRRAGNAESV